MPINNKLSLRQRYDRFVSVAEEYGYVSPLIKIGQFMTNCKSSLPEDKFKFPKEEFTAETLSEEMNVSKDVVNELAEVCSPTSLECPRESEIRDWDALEPFPEGTGLVTLEHWRESVDERKDVNSKSRRLLRSKYSEMTCAMMEKIQDIQPVDFQDAINDPELIITVTVCFPRDSRRFKSSGVDFYVLGSQKLIELKDKIPCALNERPIGNFTDNPDHPKDIKLKDVCTSSLLLIENTFYNDMRVPSSIDLSSYLVEWGKKNDSIVPTGTKSISMEDVAFNDLHIRVGCPYFFLHMGECEHIIIFKDIKLLNGSDCLSRSAYPITVSRATFKANPCEVCRQRLATWATLQDELSNRSPALFCDSCFKTLHYDKQGNKLGNFVAFPRINIAELDY